ncbi:MAG: flavin monoamine oxidase family protein [Woeseiaceae bacterium]
MSTKSLDADIAIVGAGAAGLAAAQALQARDRDFVLLEASHRIGGRAYTEPLSPDVPFDLGAHWIHSDALNPFMTIASECGADLEKDEEDYIHADYFEGGQWLPKTDYKDLSEFIELQWGAIEDAAKRGDDQSVVDVINNESRWAPYFYMFFAQNFTCDVDQVSACDAAGYVEGGIDYAVKRGFGTLLTQFGANLPVSLNTAVEEIDSSGPVIRLKTAKGELRVAKVILTVSTGVLAAQRIKFVPELPDWKVAAVRGLPMGSSTRVGLTFEESFLNDLPDDFTIRIGEDEPLHFRNRPCGYNCVEIATGGRIAEWMEKSGESATVDYVLGRLRHVLGNQQKMTVRRQIVSAWDGDAWTLGSYSYASPGAQHQRKKLAESLDERIFFAGEAASERFYATVHGAYFSAMKAVSVL